MELEFDREMIRSYDTVADVTLCQEETLESIVPDACPDLPYDLVTPEYLFYDLIYNPGETCFLRRAAERGATTKNGLEMLHLQAEASWDFWHNDD